MNVCIADVDGHNFPNLAIMKISSWHKRNGDHVEWYDPLFSNPDKVYASKVFTFTPDNDYLPEGTVKGGTGYEITSYLPQEIDDCDPDYTIYPQYDYAIGFLSRGCIRKCPWCVVPKKEGTIRKYRDIEQVAQGRKHVVLMDNNFLANEYDFIKEQLDKSVRMNIRIDFNQGLDARLVTPEIASILAKCKWMKYIRFACDTSLMIPHLNTAVKLVREHGYRGEIFVYVLAKELNESIERIQKITQIDTKIVPFCQPFRNLQTNEEPDKELRHLARWCNMQAIRKKTNFCDYKWNETKLMVEE